MRQTETHLFFFSKAFMWSNWYSSPFYVGDILFYTSEHYFIWKKYQTFVPDAPQERLAFLQIPDPKVAKAWGRPPKLPEFDESVWVGDGLGYQSMYEALFYKTSAYPNILEASLALSHLTFVEASAFDKIWGIGLWEDDDAVLNENCWQGQNLLGKCWNQLLNWYLTAPLEELESYQLSSEVMATLHLYRNRLEAAPF